MAMNSRERMLAAMEGRPVDAVPVAPYFWGAEYVWRLLGRPLWEVMHGECGVLEVLDALEERHGCDWLVPLHASDGFLRGKTLVREEADCVYFREEGTGKEWAFDRDGHWLRAAGESAEKERYSFPAEADPPRSRAEADEWLRAHFPQVYDQPAPVEPDRTVRERYPERFLCSVMWPPFAGVAMSLGFEATMFLLHDDPSLLAYMVEKAMGQTRNDCEQLAASGYDGGVMCDSMASADIMSPGDYADWVAPFHKVVSDELHRAGLKSVMYNTGNILPLLGTVRGLGYDAISPEERIKGVEMEIGAIRRELGPEQCVFGNFDSYLLLRGDREAIRREVERQLAAAEPGGFVMGTGSPVCDATDPEAIDFWIGEVRRARI